MPRTIDSIVEAHRAGRALRAAGRPSWTRVVDIKGILSESRETTPERIADVSVRLAARLRGSLPARLFDVTGDDYEQVLDDAVEDLESYTVDGLRGLEAEGVVVLDMFNARLDEIYDWADRARVWLG
jgi:hypothetical protein